MAPIFEYGKVIANRFVVLEQLSHYKELFRCKDRRKDEEVIIKVEKREDQKSFKSRLETEGQFYEILRTSQCFSFVVGYLKDDHFRYLVMKPLGDNLHEFYKQKLRQNQWNLETVVRFADQMIARVANCHIRGIVHRDIKPENFVVDKNNNKYLYLIDFNLANQFSSITFPHIPYQIRSPRHSIGNVQFLSVNAHKGIEQSRRDDMISICYSLIFLAKGCLPWSTIRSKDFNSRFEYLEAVGKKKFNCSVDELCDGLPIQFKQFMNYCLDLGFEEQPKYHEIREMFSHLLIQMKSSNVTLVNYQPKCESVSTTPTVPKKCRKSLSQQFMRHKKSLSSSPQMICR